ncbi:hypothetical protein LO762_31550 [Actinocorallia sp. API 0066]|uniref:hypothetical protein n=1 Tax=Actinocorallia sp. API 0066 TaxID=2896846 RepID=UPI001E3E47CC|nr:hypothetical protein [Actinocorallia sp. API 0066]MCD0453688.1 hypothetical protein [Actinocorallia sp. API 0066]
MEAGVSETHVLDHNGRRYELECAAKGALGNAVVLRVDGEVVAEGAKELEPVRLERDGLSVEVRFDLRHRVKRIRAKDGDRDVHFTPPPGTLLARLERWERERPVLYASRHVLLALGQVVLPLLGIGALLRLLIPNIDLPRIDLPDIPFPDLPDLPDFPDILPDIDLPDLVLPGWMQTAAQALKFVVPVLIALGVAANEIKKNRRKHAARQHEANPGVGPGDGGQTNPHEHAARDEERSGDEAGGQLSR